MSDHKCPFCLIANGKLSADVLYQDTDVTVFRDIHPVAPTHLLIIPNKHILSVAQLEEEDGALIGKMFLVAKEMAKREDVDNAGFRLITNTGSDGGQSVFHLHLHLIGGRKLSVGLG